MVFLGLLWYSLLHFYFLLLLQSRETLRSGEMDGYKNQENRTKKLETIAKGTRMTQDFAEFLKKSADTKTLPLKPS